MSAQINTPSQLQEQHCTTVLEKLLESVNKKYFKNTIQCQITWEVPRGTVTVFTGIPAKELKPGSQHDFDFQQAQSLIAKQKLSDAIPLLKGCAAENHSDSKLLLSHILKRLGDPDWQVYASSYNQHFQTTRVVPAACYYPDSEKIAIHPFLQQRNTPQFVLKYLIYHECCHQIIDSTPQHPHTEPFMVLELQAPNRNRALDWLECEGFPTLNSATEHKA